MISSRQLYPALFGLALVLVVLLALAYGLAWRPAPREAAPVRCTVQAPVLQPGQALKVMSWNVRHLAGAGPRFWRDQPADDGPPASQRDLALGLDEVVRVLHAEQADIVLLQELHDGAKASGYQDQLALLRARLGALYPCSSQAFYWKAAFVPDPQILGSVGTKLATLSRYRIAYAERLQLPGAPDNPLTRPFAPQPALLASYLPLRDGGRLAALNTHLAPLARDAAPRAGQLAALERLLGRLQEAGTPWLLGGDFGQPAAPPRGRNRPLGGLARLAERYPRLASAEPSAAHHQLFHSPRLSVLDARPPRPAATAGRPPLLARLLLPTPD